MYNKYSSWTFDEEDCLQFKGQWRTQVFNAPKNIKLDLEIGPGAGGFFSFIATQNKDRLFIAMELKYKPLIQTTRKIKESGCLNAKTIRYNARMLGDIFVPEELNNIYIHFPDPWPKKRHHKHRLIKPDFVKTLYQLQEKNSFIEIKTDHQEYFQEIHATFKNSPYKEIKFSNDLHNSQLPSQELIYRTGRESAPFGDSLPLGEKRDNQNTLASPLLSRGPDSQRSNQICITQFEKIFIRKNQAIHYLKCIK